MFYDRTRKGWPFNTSDCLIEVSLWVGLIVSSKLSQGLTPTIISQAVTPPKPL